MAPERNPRTEWACQPVTFINSSKVAPPLRFNMPSTVAVLLPVRTLSAFRAGLGDFRYWVAFFLDAALVGATWAFCGASDQGVLACSVAAIGPASGSGAGPCGP